MPTTEHTINDALAGLLTRTRSLWRNKGVIKSETTGVLKGAGKHPDILVNEPNVSPVIIETEVLPAVSVEQDARDRLGETLVPSGRKILSTVAVRLPERLRDAAGNELTQSLSEANDYEMALFTGKDPNNCTRWPRNGWVTGNLTDLSILVQSAAVPPEVVEEAANRLVDGVNTAAELLNDMAISHPGAMTRICEELKQQDDEQTRRMATTILANALVFHESLARGPEDLYEVRTLEELRGKRGGVNKTDTLEDWKRILKVNYWPIFDIARRILEVIPADTAHPLLDSLVKTAGELVAAHMMRSHDLTGSVFQKLIADRKFLAAFYTHPASAALLVGLAIGNERTPGDGLWSKAEDVTTLRVADFACGTGTLLSAAYRRISQLHEAYDGDAEVIHPDMMASALVGCDVLPAAAHLTASMLAGAHPIVKYKSGSIMTAGYGPRDGGGVSLGSLDLLSLQRTFDIVAVTTKSLDSTGEREQEAWAALPHESFDLVLMNPPFTRNTGHEGKKIGIPNPMFAAFGSKAEEQRAMAKATEAILRDTVYHGNAGEASAFLVLADRKLKPGGRLAMVMPLSLVSGEAWESARKLLSDSYSDLIIVSIAGHRPHDLSFSADTGMGECLIIGTKRKSEKRRAISIVLDERPSTPMAGAFISSETARLIGGNLRKLEDGPTSGSPLYIGEDYIGYALDVPLPEKGAWGLARVRDASLVQAAYQLNENNRIYLPGMAEDASIPVKTSTVTAIGKIGPYHMDVNGNTSDGGVRGPFRIEPLAAENAPTYPVLWAHDAPRERRMAFEADSEGFIRSGKDDADNEKIRKKAVLVWEESSHCHFNRDFQFNSQSTAMQFTDRKTIGGRAWPSIQLASPEQEKALVLWGNSSLGILLHWQHANRQQAGRGNIGVSALGSLPVLDVTALSPEKLAQAANIFEEMKHEELRPVNEIDRDPVRAKLDARLAIEVLGLSPEIAADDGPLALLRRKLAAEPSINGGKKK